MGGIGDVGGVGGSAACRSRSAEVTPTSSSHKLHPSELHQLWLSSNPDFAQPKHSRPLLRVYSPLSPPIASSSSLQLRVSSVSAHLDSQTQQQWSTSAAGRPWTGCLASRALLVVVDTPGRTINGFKRKSALVSPAAPIARANFALTCYHSPSP